MESQARCRMSTPQARRYNHRPLSSGGLSGSLKPRRPRAVSGEHACNRLRNNDKTTIHDMNSQAIVMIIIISIIIIIIIMIIIIIIISSSSSNGNNVDGDDTSTNTITARKFWRASPPRLKSSGMRAA